MRTRYGEATKDVLLSLAMAGVLVVAATSPYFLLNLAKVLLKNKRYNKYSFKRSLNGLEKNRIIIIKEKEGKFAVELSEKGKKVVKEIMFESMKIEKQKAWDKKWRIVIFDIPEKKGREARNAMRDKLEKLRFFQLQKSVWVCPYPCEKEIRLICEVFGINPYINIVTAEKIYNDDNLKKFFTL